MKFYGNIDLQNNNIQEVVIAGETSFPSNPKIGRIAYKDGILWMYTTIDGSDPFWVPLTNARTAYVHTQTTAALSWTIKHSLGSASPIVQIYDDQGEMFMPESVSIVDESSVIVRFTQNTAGKAIVVAGSGVFGSAPSSGSGASSSAAKVLTGSATVAASSTQTISLGSITGPVMFYSVGTTVSGATTYQYDVTITVDGTVVYSAQGLSSSAVDSFPFFVEKTGAAVLSIKNYQATGFSASARVVLANVVVTA